MNTLLNRTAVITGAGSGMGKAMANLFAENGANVVICDVNQKNLDDTVKEIIANGGKVTGVVANVADDKEATMLVNRAVEVYGSIDILVNNAGILDDFMTVAEMKNEMWNKVMAVNVTGPMYTCRRSLFYMLKKGKGVIINIASVGGMNGTRAGAAYTASKHAIIGLTKNIGFTYAKKGIRCVAIAPGAVNTNIGANMNPDPLGYESLSLGMGTIPRSGEPMEIAQLALFLASDQASFINGTIVTADGGWTAY